MSVLSPERPPPSLIALRTASIASRAVVSQDKRTREDLWKKNNLDASVPGKSQLLFNKTNRLQGKAILCSLTAEDGMQHETALTPLASGNHSKQP